MIDFVRVLDACAGFGCCLAEPVSRVVNDGCAVCHGRLGCCILRFHRTLLLQCMVGCRTLSLVVIAGFVGWRFLWVERCVALSRQPSPGSNARTSQETFRRGPSREF